MRSLGALLLLFQASILEPPVELRKLDYFLGTWSFEWNVPDSPLGPGGKISGKETFRKILSGFFYESSIEGDGPLGPFRALAIMGYDRAQKAYTRHEFHSTGVTLLKSGAIGSDAGGWNMLYWESTPVFRDGHTARLKGSTHMYSPVNFRLRIQISVDGGPYTNYGTPWFRKLESPR